MHVTLIEKHNSKERFVAAQKALSVILSDKEDIIDAMSVKLSPTLLETLSHDILGYRGAASIHGTGAASNSSVAGGARRIPLYDALPIRVKLSANTLDFLSGCEAFSYPMSRFLCRTKGQALTVLFAKHADWPSIGDKDGRLKLYTEFPWYTTRKGEVPTVVSEFCLNYAISVAEFRRLPLSMLFGSPNFDTVIGNGQYIRDAVNCIAAPSYDLVSLSRPSLDTLIEEWRKSKSTI